MRAQRRPVLMERGLPAPPDRPSLQGQDKCLIVNRREPIEVRPLVSVDVELTLVVVRASPEIRDPPYGAIIVFRYRVDCLELFCVQVSGPGAYNARAHRRRAKRGNPEPAKARGVRWSALLEAAIQ